MLKIEKFPCVQEVCDFFLVFFPISLSENMTYFQNVICCQIILCQILKKFKVIKVDLTYIEIVKFLDNSSVKFDQTHPKDIFKELYYTCISFGINKINKRAENSYLRVLIYNFRN